MITFDSILENIKNPNFSESDYAQLRHAYELAEYLHGGVLRESGEPYITHPLSVANIMLNNWWVDVDTLCAALLHDVIEDTDFTFQDIKRELNSNVAILVDGVTKLKGLKIPDQQLRKYANERKLFEGILVGPQIHLLKLCDRTHNMRTIGYKKVREKQIENALETLNCFVPMANRMGTSVLLNELANLSFECLSKSDYSKTEELRCQLQEEKNLEILDMLKEIQSILNQENIPNEIKFRIKNNYQLYQRLRKCYKIQDIHDLFAFKIITENSESSYRAFELLQSHFSVLKNDYRDFIVLPKENMYQSLHMGVINSNGTIYQMQIRSKRMHEISEFGYGAFWKLYGKDAIEKMKEELSRKKFYQSIQEIEELADNEEFVRQVRFEVYNTDFVHVYTPKNDMFTFPKGTTPLDFAYSIHTDLLHNYIGARVNGVLVPMNYELQNGDIVQILTHENSFGPTEDWEQIAKTIGAKRYIRRLVK